MVRSTRTNGANSAPIPSSSSASVEPSEPGQMVTTNGNLADLSTSASDPSFRDTFSYHPVTLASADALPYYDRELDLQPGLRSRVDALIAAEQETMEPLGASSSRLPPAYEIFSKRPDLQAELERVASGAPPEPSLDSKRYGLPEPEGGASASIQDWQAAVDNSYSQLAHMDIRLKNIELMKKYGSNAWRLSNFQQEQDIRMLSENVDSIKAQTNEINRLRQTEQNQTGTRLATLEKRWQDLIARSLQLEVATITTQQTVDSLHTKKRKLQAELDQLDV
ncbi:hypothetical protein BCV70DRAFT_199845 [Testicularia cyperi]|uniref:Breast carcinoma amplified sequence 2 n=1 Tax=Testicularia cyperi TaxID=1882483 RepID=A0A317XS05_9BASI|nr:hypothetical protein BCV70DRAFT_199845 [Testicularia cyperi]